MSPTNVGILLSASGDHYVAEALEAIQVSKRYNFCPHAIFCNPLPGKIPNDVLCIPFERSENPFADKLHNMALTPFEKTIFLDSDIHICASVLDVADILGPYDIAAAHAPGYRGFEDPEVPYAFFEINTGVVGYVNSEAVRTMLQEAARTHLAWCITQPKFLENCPHDQPAFRRCLWKSRLRLYVLGPEYNYRSTKPGFIVDEVRAVHGRHGDMAEVVRVLNEGSEIAAKRKRMNLPRALPAFPAVEWAAEHKGKWREADLSCTDSAPPPK